MLHVLENYILQEGLYSIYKVISCPVLGMGAEKQNNYFHGHPAHLIKINMYLIRVVHFGLIIFIPL